MELIRIPKFSENMEEATIVEWVKQEGDRVSKGDHLLTVITDKADVEIESEADGTLLKIVAGEKSSVPVNYVVAVIGEAGDAMPDYETINKEIQASTSPDEDGIAEAAGAYEAKPVGVPAAVARDGAKRVPATPAAKRLARKNGIELADVQAWANAAGPVSQEMVEAFLSEQSA